VAGLKIFGSGRGSREKAETFTFGSQKVIRITAADISTGTVTLNAHNVIIVDAEQEVNLRIGVEIVLIGT
jgi:hypothetical protein